MTQEEKHRQDASKKLSREGRKYFEFIEFDENEELITEIRKHPFGLFIVQLIGAFVILTLLVLTIFIAQVDMSEVSGDINTGLFKSLGIVLSFIAIIGAIIGTVIAVYLYKSNVIYVTSEKIAQVLYQSLFHRKISQLSIGDVQDVTVKQSGIFAHIFNYGTLVIETAGEQQNYTFTYVPEPYKYSKLIVGSHESNLKTYGN